MPAGGVTGDEDAVRIAVEAAGIVGDPFVRGAALLDDRVERHRRRQRVVERDGRATGGDEAFGGKRVHILVHGTPIAAVDEDLNRGAARRCREEVGGHVGAGAVADIEDAVERVADPRALGLPHRQILVEVRVAQAQIVARLLGKFPLLVHPHIPVVACRRHSPRSTSKAMLMRSPGPVKGRVR